MKKILKLGVPILGICSWIGNIHRISSGIDGKYKICAGSFSRNVKTSSSFGSSLNLNKIDVILITKQWLTENLKEKMELMLLQ